MPLKPNITLGESVLNGGIGPVAGDASSSMLLISSLSPSAASPYDSASMVKASIMLIRINGIGKSIMISFKSLVRIIRLPLTFFVMLVTFIILVGSIQRQRSSFS